ncbi:MAG: ABC transporter ATP-binding protein, partial [Bdellovibrionales bacterium]
LCDRLVIMDKGEIRAEGSPQKLIQDYGAGYVALFSTFDSEVLLREKNLSWEQDASGISLRAQTLEELIELQKKLNVQAMQIRPTNLEDVFLKHTGRGLSSEA